MSAPSVPTEVENALSLLETAVDALATASLTAATDDSVLDAWRRVETVRRRLDPVEHRIIGEVNDRTLAEKHACRNTAGLARQLLHLHPSEAAGRVAAARHLGSRRPTTGEPLEPTYPKVAAALADGAISSRHARVITGMLEDLPEPVRAVHGEEAEQQLTRAARSFDPKELGKLACRIAYVLDQDGRCAYRGRRILGTATRFARADLRLRLRRTLTRHMAQSGQDPPPQRPTGHQTARTARRAPS